ncbi:MAG: hypothetical protein C207_00591 [Bradyrhizobium sp. DFCI-1]|jgi:hypothetical protein|nr:MAG: hypothetical protein C207_00591 [Bradyrhizobium sp. DFCI-1]
MLSEAIEARFGLTTPIDPVAWNSTLDALIRCRG